MSKNLERTFCYWLLIFPPDIKLDNQIFSGNAAEIKIEPNPTVLKSDDELNTLKKDIRMMMVYWRIAEVGGRLRENLATSIKDEDIFED